MRGHLALGVVQVGVRGHLALGDLEVGVRGHLVLGGLHVGCSNWGLEREPLGWESNTWTTRLSYSHMQSYWLVRPSRLQIHVRTKCFHLIIVSTGKIDIKERRVVRPEADVPGLTDGGTSCSGT